VRVVEKYIERRDTAYRGGLTFKIIAFDNRPFQPATKDYSAAVALQIVVHNAEAAIDRATGTIGDRDCGIAGDETRAEDLVARDQSGVERRIIRENRFF